MSLVLPSLLGLAKGSGGAAPPPPPPATYRYVKLHAITQNGGDPYLSLLQVEFHHIAGGPQFATPDNTTVAGPAHADDPANYGPANLIDTGAARWIVDLDQLPADVVFDFGSPQALAEIGMWADYDDNGYTRSPNSFTWSGSNNLTDWTVLITKSGVIWFDKVTVPVISKNHRYWRLHTTATVGDPAYISLSEFEFHHTVGGTQFASSSNTTTLALPGDTLDAYPTSNLLDSDPNTRWIAKFGYGYEYVTFDLGSVQTVAEVVMQPGYNDNPVIRAPRDFTIAYSDDGTDYTVDSTVVNQDWRSTRTYPVGP